MGATGVVEGWRTIQVGPICMMNDVLGFCIVGNCSLAADVILAAHLP